MSAAPTLAPPVTLPAALDALKCYPQWIIYQLHDRDPVTRKWKKRPIDYRTGAMAPKDHGGIEICTTFENVAAIAPNLGPDYVPGFYFTADDPFFFLDIDNCAVLDAQGATMGWNTIAQDLCRQFAGAAIEISSSGRGLHIIGRGTVPAHSCKHTELGLELYTQDRGVALTGEGAQGDAGSDHTAALSPLVAAYFTPKAVDTSAQWTDAPVWPIDAAPLAERIEARKRASPVFAALMDGDADTLAAHWPKDDGALDASSADFALACELLPLHGGDCNAVLDALSANDHPLAREKWTDGYLRRTILKAFQKVAPTAPPSVFGNQPPVLLPTLTEAPAIAPRFVVLTAADVVAQPAVSWLAKGVLPDSGLAAIYGPSGSGKSFLALDLLAAIAKGSPWFGHRVKAAPVLYIALEGEAGLGQRLRAYSARNALPTEMRFIAAALDLRLAADVALLIGAVRAAGWPGHGVIAVDTLNASIPGADENSSIDMGLAIAALHGLRREFAGLVLVIHHTGKDTSKGMRGHSSLYAALDAAVEVMRDVNGRSWKVAKAKDGADGAERSFALEVVPLGLDADGDPVTSCVVRVPESMAVRHAEDLSPQQKIIWDALWTLFAAAPTTRQEGAPASVPANTPCLRYKDAVKDVKGNLVSVPPKRRGERTKDAITGLINHGLIGADKLWLWPKR